MDLEETHSKSCMLFFTGVLIISCSAGCLIWFLNLLRSSLLGSYGIEQLTSEFCGKAKRDRHIATSQLHLSLAYRDLLPCFLQDLKVLHQKKKKSQPVSQNQIITVVISYNLILLLLMSNLLEFFSPVPKLLLVVPNPTDIVQWPIWTWKVSLAFMMSCGFF